MNTYLIPVKERDSLYIKKIVAPSESAAEDKLYEYFYNKYEDIEGTNLEEIRDPLWDLDIEFGQIYEIDELS